ncbi:MAG: 2-oxo acid dehydrogenase [Deltaproteobacteria bacterium]|nr:MAG: 2-oxo acid dehydrogenase [Deltaproteobacteria bacterium]
MPNLELQHKRDLSPFRRIAIGTWETTYDPSVYGKLTLRMERALAYRDAYRAATGKRLTVTHMMAKAVGAVLADMPDANAILRFNRIYLRKRIGVFLQVVLTDPQTGQIDLSGTTVYDPEQKSLADIIDELERRVERVRADRDRRFRSSRGMFRRVPSLLLNRVMKAVSWLSYTANLDLRWAGVPRDPFGSVMITNIGSIGLSEAYVPLVPYSRVPLVIAMGAVEDQPVVDGGAVVPGKVMAVNATFDHRVLDGAHAARMARTLRAWMEDPFAHFDPLPADSRAGAAGSSPA